MNTNAEEFKTVELVRQHFTAKPEKQDSSFSIRMSGCSGRLRIASFLLNRPEDKLQQHLALWHQKCTQTRTTQDMLISSELHLIRAPLKGQTSHHMLPVLMSPYGHGNLGEREKYTAGTKTRLDHYICEVTVSVPADNFPRIIPKCWSVLSLVSKMACRYAATTGTQKQLYYCSL